MNKVSWDKYFMSITKIVSLKSSCSRRQVGAVIVKDNRIISTGYNGTPRGIKNCNEGGCPRALSDHKSGTKLDDDAICNHAEENAILQVAYQGGTPIEGATIYTTTEPCILCCKMIAQVGIKRILYLEKYHPTPTILNIYKEAKISYEQFKGKLLSL